MVKKRGINETLITAEDAVGSTIDLEILTDSEGNSEYENLLACLQEIRKNEDLLGYILKGGLKATVDLNEPDRIE